MAWPMARILPPVPTSVKRNQARINLGVSCLWKCSRFERNGPSAGAEEAEKLDLEKHARLEAGLIDPESAIQPALTAEHQHQEGLSFWQAIKTMFK